MTTADLQGNMEPLRTSGKVNSEQKDRVAGGISRIASLIKEIKAENRDPVIILTAGDDLMGRYFHNFSGKAISKLLDTAGYDIFALGNHEFDSGPGILGEALSQAQFTTLCSDLNIKDTALDGNCQQLLIQTYGDISVGYFSLMTPEFSSVTNGGDVSRKNSTFFDIAEKMVATLQRQNVDLIVAVTHIGFDLDQKLATAVNGIDIIIGGHSHDYLEQLETINNTLIVNGGEKGTALVRLDVQLTSNKKLLPNSAKYSLLPVLESIPEDKATAAQLKLFSDQLPPTTVLGSTEKVWHLDKQSLRSQESSVADMVNNLILKKFKVDLVLNNGGAFRGKNSYPAGPVTDTMLQEIDGFENDIYLLKIKGEYLLEILEHSATSLGHGGFLQIAGMKIKIQTTNQKQEIRKENGQWRISQSGKQIVDVQIRNDDGSYSTLNPEKEYSVATNAFLANYEGDNYFWFKTYGHEQSNTYTTLASIMAMEIHESKILNPPDRDGRIVLINTK